MTTALSFQPPTGDLFAAVQVEATSDGQEWRVVGASPAFRLVPRPTGRMIEVDGEQVPEVCSVMVPSSSVGVDCKLTPQDRQVRLLWVCEDSSRGTIPEGPLQIPSHGAAHTGAATYGGGR